MSATLIVAVAGILSFSAPAPAEAITRTKIIKRAKHWVQKRVPYSQRGYYRGYRRDCSGFVSMAWGLNRSYTTRNISSKARRVGISSLKPGDAVLTRGHVAIFGGWKNKKKRTYYALEETTWGSHAKKRVRKIPRGAKGLRRKNLTPVRQVATAAPRTPVSSASVSGSVTNASVTTTETVQATPFSYTVTRVLGPTQFLPPPERPLHRLIA